MPYRRSNQHTPFPLASILKWIGTIGVTIAIVCIALCIGIYYYLTPSRLADIIDKEASNYLNADLEVGDVHYTLFSSFPWINVEIDSLRVTSGAFANLPDSLKNKLPEKAEVLLTTGKIEGSINLKKLLKGKIRLGNIAINRPDVNVVKLNDSTANYNIFPPLKWKLKKLDIKFKSISIATPILLDFYDIEKDIAISSKTSDFHIDKVKDRNNAYSFGIESIVDGHYGDISLPKPMAMGLSGETIYDLKPFSLAVSNLKFNLPSLSSILNITLDKEGNDAIVNTFNLAVSSPDIFETLKYIPPQLFKDVSFPIEGGGKLPLRLDIDLGSALNLSALQDTDDKMRLLPSFNVRLNISDASLDLSRRGKLMMEITHIDFTGEGKYDARNITDSYIHIPNLSLYENGLWVSLVADAEKILTPARHITGKINIDANLHTALKHFMKQAGVKLAGTLKGNMEFSFGLPDISTFTITNPVIGGNIEIPKLAVSGNMGDADASGIWLKFDGNCRSASINKMENVALNLQCSAGKGDVRNDSLRTQVSDFRLNGKFTLPGSNALNSSRGNITIKSGTFDFSQPGTSAGVKDLSLIITPYKSKVTHVSPTSISPQYSSPDDSIILARVNHTPVWLTPGIGAIYQMLPFTPDIAVTATGGYLKTDAYLADIRLGGTAISTNLDSVDIKEISASIDDSSLTLHGKISGIRQFLSSMQPSPLKIKVDAKFNNVDINCLSGAYYAAMEKNTGKPYDFSMPPQGPYTTADSLCVLIPRNIDAAIRLRSDSAEYMGYVFSPLSTDIIVKAGDATLSRLSIGTPYTDVTVDWTYATSDASKIHMDLNADINDFDLSRFFKVFPQLTSSAPEINNLAGIISAKAGGSFEMFPTMFLNTASLDGKFRINAGNLSFARSGKIERITHLMRIEGDEPIEISDIAITGAFHDNFLQVNPFKITFGDYQIGVAGVNNLQSEMYYHVALEKSPLHMPFAINLVGKFPHPEVRFGGIEVKDGRERMISSDLESDASVNIMAYLRRGWQMFLNEAAKYYLHHESK